MGKNLFGANISGKIAQALGGSFLPGTLYRVTPGTRDPNNLAAGTQPTETAHSFRGILTGVSGLRKETILPNTKDVVLILGDTIKPSAVPVVNDRVLFESTEFTINAVDRDPDAATYTCQVK